MATARTLARRPRCAARVLNPRTVLIENVSVWAKEHGDLTRTNLAARYADGGGSVACAVMQVLLFDSARRWAHAGLDAYAQQEPDHDFAVHHVAVALEHLAKAYLCSVHPTLIAAPDFDSLLHLVDQGAHASRPAHRVRTIGMADANQRVRQLLKTAYSYDGNPSNDPVLAARNGVAHAGLWPPEEARRVLALAVRRVDAILAALDRGRESFWGGHADITAKIVDEAIADITLRVEARIRAARERYAERFSSLSQEARQAVISVLAESSPPFDVNFETERYRCRACGNQAWLGGFTETRFDLAYFDTPCGEAAKAIVVFNPLMFHCSVCDLDLNDDELQQAGIEDLIEPPDAEPDIPEPDEDWLRDELAGYHDRDDD
jgi:hypothetical protein